MKFKAGDIVLLKSDADIIWDITVPDTSSVKMRKKYCNKKDVITGCYTTSCGSEAFYVRVSMLETMGWVAECFVDYQREQMIELENIL